MGDMNESDRRRMLAVEASRLRGVARSWRDKRSGAGERRYARQAGDHFLLLGACAGSQGCVRVGSSYSVCSLCGGAVLTSEEKRAAARAPAG